MQLKDFPTNEYVETAFLCMSDAANSVQNNIYNYYNKNYHKAVASVGSLSESDKLMFQNNVSKMAAAKAYKLDKALSGLDPNDKDYGEKYNALTKKFNRYQVSEYNAIVHRARMSDQFATFQKEAKLYPNLQWIRTRSVSPCESHLEYAGRIWPMNDPFWSENSPGCMWNCKCSWRTTDAEPTENGGLRRVTPAKGLEGNPYYTKELVTNDHPYYEGIPKHIPDVGVLKNPDDVCFVKQEINGKEFKMHYNCIKAEETLANKKIVGDLLDAGFQDIKLMPQIHESEVALRNRYYGANYNKLHPKSNPDAIIDGHLVEFKKCGYNKLGTRLGSAAKKADIAVIEVTGDIDIDRFISGAWERKDIDNLKTIIIINKGKTTVFNR